MASSVTHALTVDLEPWCTKGSALFGDTGGLDEDDWPKDALRHNVRCLLELLDRHEVRATFFVLGPVARAMPGLVRSLADAGHEIALHGCRHRLVYLCSPEEFREDVLKSMEVVSSAAGTKPIGYRAPYFSITRRCMWALDALAEVGLCYDSSIFPIRRRLYGVPDFHTEAVVVETESGRRILEVPPATLRWGRLRVPVAGGGYWRVLPRSLIVAALRALARRGQPAVLYVHPYELNPQDARLDGGAANWRNRAMLAWQRAGRKGFAAKLQAVLSQFNVAPIREVFAERISAVAGTSRPSEGAEDV